MIGLVVCDEAALRADAADLVGTILNELFHELSRTEYLFLVHQVCGKHGVDFTPTDRPLRDAA
jgi:hypothetical protein